MKFAFAHKAANSSILCVVWVLICLEWSAAVNQRDSSAEAISQTHNETVDSSWKSVERSLLQTISCFSSYKLGERQVYLHINKREKSHLKIISVNSPAEAEIMELATWNLPTLQGDSCLKEETMSRVQRNRRSCEWRLQGMFLPSRVYC